MYANIEPWWIWMTLAAALLAAECIRAKSLFLWFGIGAAASGILALLTVPPAGQVFVFVNVSGILILLEKRFLERYQFKKPDVPPPLFNSAVIIPDGAADYSGEEKKEREKEQEDKSNIFRKTGDVWEIRYAGESLIARHSIGLTHIRNLIIHGGEWLHCSDLKRIASVSPGGGRFAHYVGMDSENLELENLRADSSLPPEKIIDRLSLAQIRKLRDFLAERKAADDFADPEERVDQLDRLDFIEKYLAAATDKSGRPRTVLDQNDTDRKAVSIAINRSRNNLGKLPELQIHFKSFIQAEGNSFRYLPDRPIEWKTE